MPLKFVISLQSEDWNNEMILDTQMKLLNFSSFSVWPVIDYLAEGEANKS